MFILTNEEMNTVSGGAIKLGLAFIIAAGISFVAGIIDGFLNPIKCRK